MPSDALNKLTIDKTQQKPVSGSRRGMRPAMISCGILILLFALVFVIRGRAVTIETTTATLVYPTQSFTRLNASGYVVAQRRAAVASKITGRLEWLGVEEGSRVSGGQIIARLENRDLAADVRQSEAGLSNARSVLEQARAELSDAGQSFRRQKELLKQGIVAQADYDLAEARFRKAVAGTSGAEANVRVADATLSGARVSFDYSLIRAPFDAVVLTKNADVGDIITPLGAAANAKAAVFTIADMGSLQVEADVSESNLGLVKKGQPCEISLDALPNVRFRGVVHTIVPTADRSKASVMVKVSFVDLDSRILPEMSAKVAFLEREAGKEDQRPRIAVNPAAIVRSGGRDGLFLVRGDRVEFVQVKRGARFGDQLEVSGVKSGDRVALRPLEKLKDGCRVVLTEKK
ncbi:MAG: efflux RND transporter periplasmic adaptor subunit [Desulfuromonadales bacterium]|nr:efflux RND transporter periplasmic adaptor subunit [Desulfuromonadales bacterium]